MFSGARRPNENEAEIVHFFEHSANNGEIAAMVQLGDTYYYGKNGVRQDPVRLLSILSLHPLTTT